MSVYGFRIHEVTAHPARKRPRLEFGGAGLDDPIGTLKQQISLVEGRTFVRDATYDLEGGSGSTVTVPARTPVLRVDKVQCSGNRAEFSLSYGRTGEHAFVMRTDGQPDLPLDDAAPSRHYNAVLYLPRAGDRALLLSEVKGRTFAGMMLMKRLSVEAARAAASGPDQDDWIRWMPVAVFDEARIDAVLSDGSLDGIRLTRTAQTVGGARKTKALTLTQDGVPAGREKTARDLVKGWLRRAGRTMTGQDMSTLVQMVDGDVGGLDFTDGVITFDEGGKIQSVSPSKLEKIQVYPIGPDRPSVLQLRDAARSSLTRIAQIEGIPIDFD